MRQHDLLSRDDQVRDRLRSALDGSALICRPGGAIGRRHRIAAQGDDNAHAGSFRTRSMKDQLCQDDARQALAIIAQPEELYWQASQPARGKFADSARQRPAVEGEVPGGNVAGQPDTVHAAEELRTVGGPRPRVHTEHDRHAPASSDPLAGTARPCRETAGAASLTAAGRDPRRRCAPGRRECAHRCGRRQSLLVAGRDDPLELGAIPVGHGIRDGPSIHEDAARLSRAGALASRSDTYSLLIPPARSRPSRPARPGRTRCARRGSAARGDSSGHRGRSESAGRAV